MTEHLHLAVNTADITLGIIGAIAYLAVYIPLFLRGHKLYTEHLHRVAKRRNA